MRPMTTSLRVGAVVAGMALLALLGATQWAVSQGEANLRPTSLRVVPFEVQEGIDREVTLISDVENAGEAAVDAVTVAFYRREVGTEAWTPVDRVELTDLDPGNKVQAQSKLLVFDPSKPDAGGLTAGTYEIRAVVDPDDAIAESDETDNRIATADSLEFEQRRAPHLRILHHRLSWQVRIPSERAIRGSVAQGPDGTLYAAADDGRLHAVTPADSDAMEGSLAWMFPAQGQDPLAPIRTAPTLASDGTIYVSTQAGRVHAVTPSGEAKWSSPVETETALSGLAVSPDQPLVYAGGEDGLLYRIWDHPAQGETPSYGEITRRLEIGAPVRSAPVITNEGTLYVGADNGRLYGFQSGLQAKWDAPFATGAFLRAAPAVENAFLYLGSGDGTLYALEDQGDRVHLRWDFPVGTSMRTTPAIDAEGDVYLGADDGRVYALQSNGTLKWRFRAEGSIQASAAIGPDGTVLVASTEGTLYALDRESGQLRYSVPLGDMVTGDLLVQDEVVYVSTWDGHVRAFDASLTTE